MRKRTVLWQLFVLLFITAEIHAQEFPSKWYFGKDYHQKVKESWCSEGTMKPSEYGDALLKARKADGSLPDSCTFYRYRPMAGPMAAGDCIVMEFPQSHLPAGSYVEFDLTFAAEKGAPSLWVFEWYDDGKWHSGRTYKVYGAPFHREIHQYTSVLETVKLISAADGTLKMRMRALESEAVTAPEGEKTRLRAAVLMQTHAYLGAYAQDLGVTAPKDTTKVLCVGNSFTYYCSCPALLKEIAWNEGHYIEMTAAMKGGRNFGQHCQLNVTSDAIARGGFDYVILQDQSQTPGRIGQNKKAHIQSLNDAVALAGKVRTAAPNSTIIIEATWSYKDKEYGGFGSFAAFEKYNKKGARIMAKAIGADHALVSNIVKAFSIVRKERADINLFAADERHQNLLGSYLKSCVNYLTLFGEPFGENPADCGIEPELARYLRSVAERVVL
ncbi:MAG: hypothetical protein II276_00055 [Bacteroidales bacterium]|nr:hypothetical protein [Bacteroidales bacterium]